MEFFWETPAILENPLGVSICDAHELGAQFLTPP
jgi:hypothetical protein